MGAMLIHGDQGPEEEDDDVRWLWPVVVFFFFAFLYIGALILIWNH